MTELFEKSSINGLSLPNRFVRSATWTGLASEKGEVTDELIDFYRELGKGGIGALISGFAYVDERGKAGVRQLGVHNDELVSGLSNFVNDVHEAGGRIILQLAHGGFFANPKLIDDLPLAPTNVDGIANAPRVEMSREQILDVVEAFGEASDRAKEAGFDGVQLHMAHGYLLNQFLSPAFNKRNDEFGGGLEERARFPLMVLEEVRETVGSDYPLLAKLNCRDFYNDGLEIEEALQIGELLEDAGLDALEVSGGTFVSGENNPSRENIQSTEDEAYFQKEAKQFSEHLNIPIMLVGGIRSYEIAKKIVEEKDIAEYVSLSRPLIYNPNLVNDWKQEKREESSCISCNKCLEIGVFGDGIRCTMKEDS